MGKIRVAIIGLGVGERHIRCFDAHSECEVVALCDCDEDKLKSVGERYPDKEPFSDAAELLERSDIDLVSVATYDDAHFGQAILAIKNDKHLFVEKPLCLYEKEAVELRRLLREKPHLHLSSNLVLRVSSRFQEMRERIGDGEFGDIYYLEGDYQYGRLEKITTSWRGELDFYSIVHGGAVHVIDLLLWMTGDEVEEVSAYGNQIASRGTSFRFNDMVAALLKLKSGAIAKITANFGCRRPHYHAVEVFGTKKAFVNRPGSAEIFESTEKGSAPAEMATPYYDYQKPDLICSYVDSLLGKGEPIVSADDVFRTMAVCFAIEESVAKGRPVKVKAI